MKRWTVYTDHGEYTGVLARSAAHAESIVWGWTLGRVTNMKAVCE